jgi:hypothetical protein
MEEIQKKDISNFEKINLNFFCIRDNNWLINISSNINKYIIFQNL